MIRMAMGQEKCLRLKIKFGKPINGYMFNFIKKPSKSTHLLMTNLYKMKTMEPSISLLNCHMWFVWARYVIYIVVYIVQPIDGCDVYFFFFQNYISLTYNWSKLNKWNTFYLFKQWKTSISTQATAFSFINPYIYYNEFVC